ncbi:hypothetical protein K440DRAFT_205265 [Wilcoxina mikolae CBS 423.85]|nr:hypothetical protein K440DRAFT_205265 [Wilcoxina mikolae CBS 423.85]
MSEKPATTTEHGLPPSSNSNNSNISIPPCTPPCTPPCGLHPQSQPLSDHLLLYILPYLPVTTLLQLRAVNRHWHTVISTRRPLRSACFTLPPTTPAIGGSTFELHPVFKKLDYWGYDLHLPTCTPLDGRAQICGRSVMGEVAGEAMACRPAVREVGVWLCGGVQYTVKREEGVRVKDLVEGFDAVVQERRNAGEGERRFVWDYKIYP